MAMVHGPQLLIFTVRPSGFDDLVTIEYVSTGAPNPMVTFDWAYATYPGAVDHLEIYYSTDQVQPGYY